MPPSRWFIRTVRRKVPQFVIRALTHPPEMALNVGLYASASPAADSLEWGMNKQDLIGHVADRAGISRSDSARAVETMLEVITSALKRGDEVRLVGFGNFSVTRRKASTGRNPRTGEPMQIKASSQPKFRPGKILKDAVQ